MRDAIGRRWQLSTIQYDFNLPERFELEYVGADNERHQPVMIHRALFGSVERFFGVLVEHYAGAFPTWLAPVQARVLPVAEDHEAYAARWPIGCGARASGSTRWAPTRRSAPASATAKLEKLPYVQGDGPNATCSSTTSSPGSGARWPWPGRRRLSAARAGAPLERLADHLRVVRPSARRGGHGDGVGVHPDPRVGLPDEETHIVHRGTMVFAILNAYPYSTAHTMVLPYREVPELEDLTADEHTELWATVTDAVRAVKAAYSPEGINVGLNLGRPAGGGVLAAPPRPCRASMDR